MIVRYASFLFFPALVHGVPGVMPFLGLEPTPLGLMASAGISPRPTEAPNWDGIPKELLRRQNVQFPPPENWCGFVNGIYQDVLSCSIGLTCVNSGAALGCCTATTGICTALYTSCANYRDTCGSSCLADVGVLKCNAVYPYCGAYSFYGGTYLYNCNPTVQSVTSVEFLNDFYETAIGSTVGPDSSAILPFTDGITQAAASTTSTDSTSTPFGGSSSSDDEDQQSDNGLSTAAIDGIAVACSLVGAVILGVLAFFLVRSRKKKRWAAAQAQAGNAPGGPPMQPYPQQVYSVPGKSPDGNYQPGFSPPQTDGTVPMTPAPQYSTPPPQTQSPYYPPPSQPGSPLPGTMTQSSAYSPSNYTSGAPPTITDPNTLSPNPAASTNPPSMYSASGTMDTRQSYYQPPHSPYTQEVDATLGNPSIPVGGAAPTASAANPREVDATSGNPGMPHEGSGIPPLQGLPGGSPSSTEIEGRNVSGGLNAAAADGNHTPGGIAPGTGPIGPGGPPQGGLGSSLNAPWSDHGPYEMGTDRERL